MEYSKTGIIVVNWKAPYDTIRCIESLKRLDYPNYNIIVVDNGSGQVQEIKSKFPELALHILNTNHGFTGGYNYGINIALEMGCEYIWLVNDDLIVAPNCLTTLINEFKRLPDAAFIGPLVSTIEQPDVILSAGGSVVERSFLLNHIGEHVSDVSLAVQPVDYLSGCAILTRSNVIHKVGFLYEPYFAYDEDVEWCYRAKRANLKTYIIPMAKVWHPDTRLRDENSPLVTYYINRNSLYFFSRYFGLIDVLLQLIGNFRTIGSWTIQNKWKHKRHQRDALMKSMIDFFFRRTGPFVE